MLGSKLSPFLLTGHPVRKDGIPKRSSRLPRWLALYEPAIGQGLDVDPNPRNKLAALNADMTMAPADQRAPLPWKLRHRNKFSTSATPASRAVDGSGC